MTLRFVAPLRCGRPAGAPLAVKLPLAARLPASISPNAVTVNGQPSDAVEVTGHVIGIRLSAATTTCYAITEGPVTVVFTRLARLANPAHAGAYPVTLVRGASTFRGELVVRN